MKKNISSSLISALVCILCFTRLIFAQIEPERLHWYRWDEGIQRAYDTKKFALIYIFYKPRVNQVLHMDVGAFADPIAQDLLEKYFIPIRLDARSEDIVSVGTERYTQIEWVEKLHIEKYPTILVYDADLHFVARGNEFAAPEFVQFLKYIRGEYYKDYSFETFKHLKASE
jgi:thioredoxin-related protein